jgi:hypothetical protein
MSNFALHIWRRYKSAIFVPKKSIPIIYEGYKRYFEVALMIHILLSDGTIFHTKRPT